MGAFICFSEDPNHGSMGRSRYPGEWDDQQVMSPTRVRFTPATGDFAGDDLWFYYYRGLDKLIGEGGVSQIGVRTADVATFNGTNWDDQRAKNPVIVNDFPGAPAPVAGGLYNDFRAFVYNSKIRLTIAIYGNPSGSNRTAIFESDDGYTFTYVGEATKDGTYLGRTIGAIENVGGTLVSLVSIADGAGGGNGRQKWISNDGGLTWLDRGLAVPVGVEGDWNGLTYLGGTMELIGDYYVALLHGMPFIGYSSGVTPYLDWPEAFGAFRCHVDDILTADVIWEANAQNPLFIAGPTHGATWHAALYQNKGSTFAHMETWGVPGFNNIGNATNMALRDTPYFGLGSKVSSSQIYMLEMKDRGWIDNWTTPIFADGDYTLRHVSSGDAGKFVGIVGGAPVPVINDEGEIAKFSIDRQLSFYRFRSGGVSMRAPSEFNGAGVVMETSPGVLTNQAGQWDVMPWGDPVPGGGRQVVLTNRYTRMALSLSNGTEADGSPLICAPFTGDPAQVFEVMPYRPSSTTTEFPDPENPGLNLLLGTGDIVTTTEPQTVTNKTMVNNITRAALVTRAAAGEFDGLADGAVIEADGLAFRKQAGANYAGLPVGFVPSGGITTSHFGSIGITSTVDTSAIANAWEYAFALSIVDGARIEVSGSGLSHVVQPIITPSGSGSVALTNIHLVADLTASWSDTNYMMDIRGSKNLISNVSCDGELVANIIRHRASNTHYEKCDWSRFRQTDLGTGFVADGGFVPTMDTVRIRGLIPADAAYLTQSERKGTCLKTDQVGDGKFFNVTCHSGAVNLDNWGNENRFVGCHFYNGSGEVGVVFSDTINVINRNGYTVFVGCYFDNGYIDLIDEHVLISGCSFLYSTDKTTLSSFIRVIAQSLDQVLTGPTIGVNDFTKNPSIDMISFVEDVPNSKTFAATLPNNQRPIGTMSAWQGFTLVSWQDSTTSPLYLVSNNVQSMARFEGTSTSISGGIKAGASGNAFEVFVGTTANVHVEADRIGLFTDAPSSRVHIVGENGKVAVPSYHPSNDLVIEDVGDATLQIIAGATSMAAVRFSGDGVGSTPAYLGYDVATDDLWLRSSGALKMRSGGASFGFDLSAAGAMVPVSGVQTIGSNSVQLAELWTTDMRFGANKRKFTGGVGSPNGVVSGSYGSIYTDQSAPTLATAIWVKVTTTSTTGWAPVRASVEPCLVAALPSAASAGVGAEGWVTDATVTWAAGIGAIVAGGGANAVPVKSDGTNWRIG